MIGLLQRVTEASVRVDGQLIGRIGQGLLVLSCVEPDDGPREAARLAQRICGYRVFSDEAGKMNLSVSDIGGSVLLVPQFTLAADTRKGMRPSFTRAAPPAVAAELFEVLCDEVENCGVGLNRGQFGADMSVSLTNDGPVTFWLTA